MVKKEANERRKQNRLQEHHKFTVYVVPYEGEPYTARARYSAALE
jgi:hypothetical protein